MEENTQNQTPHIVILPSPGMGHIIPLGEFARKLISLHNFTVTFTIPTGNSPSKAMISYLQSLPKAIDYTFLPPVPLDDLPDPAKIETRISLTVNRSLDVIRDALKSFTATKRVVALVVDIFGTDAFDVAWEFKIKPYIFFTTNAMVLSFVKHLPELDKSITGEFRDLTEKLKFPGCVPIHGKDLLDPVQDRSDEAYKWFLHHAKRYELAEGIVANTFAELEPRALTELKQRKDWPSVYFVGPLIQCNKDTPDEQCEILKWLDEQPHGSVLFVSFGSGGTLSSIQIEELAMGLEMSGQRFLWVVRSPSDEIANATYFTVQSINDPLSFLPEGFLERTKNLGLVVPNWAPQVKVLSHGSTAGFLSHCGWNSILESVVHGVPLITWPLYAEQKMNAVMLVEDLEVALKPEFAENGIVYRDDIARVVKGLVEGEEGKSLRSKMRDLKESAAMAFCENGSSTNSLSELAQKWKNN
ncbi:hypothetical protein Scep_025744 [Stephania cephalantha]|uniref:Glycosyltransferase n=1 Tax=Stephania cephalantha TaxID=152367 RepID=A0AAP0HSQ9_9MAGN